MSASEDKRLVTQTDVRAVLYRHQIYQQPGLYADAPARQVAQALLRLEDEIKKLRAMQAPEWRSNDGA